VFDSCNNSIKLSEEILVKSQEWCKKAKAFKLQFEKAVDAFVVDTNKKIEREKKLNSKISKKNNEFKTLTETYIQTYNNAKTLLENCLSQLVSINVGDCRRLERTDIYEDYQTKFNGIKDQLAEIQNAAIEMESLHKMLQDHSGLDDLENYLNQLTNSCDSIIQLTEKAKRIINECEIIYPTLVKFIDNETTMLNAERKIKLTLLDSMGNKIATMSCGDYRKIEPNDDKGWVRAMPKAILMLDEIKKYDLGIGYGIVGEYNTTDEAFCEDMTGVRFFLGSEPYVTANKPFTIKVKYKETEYLPFDPYKFEFLTEIVQYTITTAENKIVNFTLLKEH
ncbi:MAG: hypothetical protein LBM93_04940, partial [Oscillospiraceae bacterium]|jgi:hypothetical protein|nr:hypothetical protein [Oscillospiraceae bacterium]